MEKLLHERLIMGFLNDQKILCRKQFRFQKTFSAAHAVISFIENIEKAIDNKVFVCEVFFELQKAFDTVDHNILLHKLSHYRIRDKSNSWFSSYLSDRKQFVTINGFDSEIQSFQCGVLNNTCLLNIQNTISEINRSLNKDLKELSFW